jgi:hypothetical protein
MVIALSAFHLGLMFGGSPSSNGCLERALPTDKILDPPPVVAAATTTTTTAAPVFPRTMAKFIDSAALVDRDDFIATQDFGIPWDLTKDGNKEVLILYNHKGSVPTAKPQPTGSDGPSSLLPLYSAVDATANCNVLQVVLIQPDQVNQCVAVVGQWQSYHVHKLMRLEKDNVPSKGVDKAYDLRYVSRHHLNDGYKTKLPPASALTDQYGNALILYLQKLPATLDRLRPIAAQVAGGGTELGTNSAKTIVVMVCNFGQSELLFNFVCTAKSRNLDLSKILLFATDADIIDLAKALGLAVFDVQDAFGDMPTGAAQTYGDRTFAGMIRIYIHVYIYLCLHFVFVSCLCLTHTSCRRFPQKRHDDG